MKAIKVILAIAMLVGFVSALQYIFEVSSDSFELICHDYAYKQDYIEQKYNEYRVYRYYSWLKEILPKDSSYGLLVSKDDNRSYGRYLNRMNYFLYPQHIGDENSTILFAPKLSSFTLNVNAKGSKYVVHNGKYYYLTSFKDDSGVFIRK